MVKVAPIVIRCLGGGIKQLEEDIRDFLNEKERLTIVGKMQRNVLRESKFIVRKSYVRTDKLNVFNKATETY